MIEFLIWFAISVGAGISAYKTEMKTSPFEPENVVFAWFGLVVGFFLWPIWLGKLIAVKYLLNNEV